MYAKPRPSLRDGHGEALPSAWESQLQTLLALGAYDAAANSSLETLSPVSGALTWKVGDHQVKSPFHLSGREDLNRDLPSLRQVS